MYKTRQTGIAVRKLAIGRANTITDTSSTVIPICTVSLERTELSNNHLESRVVVFNLQQHVHVQPGADVLFPPT